ncbi:hypothetical protein [Pseudooceanicola sp. LIPI14-2-Ac024]|uniref:hypothetical protein n=1 Tax=Pseudooceanicola sp. LIPI14-2-Ac024 TaxID=3344875 RepID=UPI0035D11DB3
MAKRIGGQMTGLGVAAGWAMLALGQPVAAQSLAEAQPGHYTSFTTANMLPRGAARIELGFQQTNPSIETPGTSNQTYFASVAFAPVNGLEFGADYMNFNDPPPGDIAGSRPNTAVVGGGPWAKVRLYESGPLSIAAQASAEYIKFNSSFYGSDTHEYFFIGSAHLPMTYDISPTLQAHLTPGVTVMPETRNGNDFYGTIASIGAGLSWKPSDRTLVYASVTQPMMGANTVMSDGSYGRRPVITVGSRYAIAPNTALEVWGTNGFGATPATGVLTFFPDGDLLLVGAKVVHTFGPGAPDPGAYDRAPGTVLSPQQAGLAGDGFTLPGPRTRDRGTVVGTAFYGNQGAYGAAVTLAPDHMFEMTASYESIADDGSGSSDKLSSDTNRWTGLVKLQFLDQADNWPVSLSYIASLGRDEDLHGTFYTALPMMREVNDRLALRVVPQAAFYGDTAVYIGEFKEYGLGFGATYSVLPGVNVFGEYTLRNHGDDIWAVGAKGRLGTAPVELGLHATNAIGAYGVNAMTSQEDPRVVLSVSVLGDLFR